MLTEIKFASLADHYLLDKRVQSDQCTQYFNISSNPNVNVSLSFPPSIPPSLPPSVSASLPHLFVHCTDCHWCSGFVSNHCLPDTAIDLVCVANLQGSHSTEQKQGTIPQSSQCLTIVVISHMKYDSMIRNIAHLLW